MKRVSLLVFLFFKITMQIYAFDFNASATKNCSPLVTTFTHSFSNVQSVNWNFGDGTNSIINSPGKVYTIPGNFTVTLNVTFVGGATTTVSKVGYIQVSSLPTSNFTHQIVNAANCKSTIQVDFTNTSSSNIIGSIWDFGDGAFSNLHSPTHIYTKSGVYKIVLQVFSPDSCKETKILNIPVVISSSIVPNFVTTDTLFCSSVGPTVFTNTTVSQNALSSSFWTFANQGTSNQFSPLFQFANTGVYNVKLVVTDSIGCKDSVNRVVRVSILSKPTAANVMASATNACKDDILGFVTNITGRTVKWNFGPPTSTISGASVTYKFTNNGAHTVTVYYNYQNKCFDTLVLPNYININSNVNPQMTVKVTPSCGYPINYTVKNNTAGFLTHRYIVYNTANNVVDSSSTDSIFLVLNRGGQYRIRYTGFAGGSCAFDTTMVLNVPYLDTKASILAIPDSGCAPLKVSFKDNSIIKYGDSIVYSYWEFGDSTSGANNTSTLLNPSHVYRNIGTYNVTHYIYTREGCYYSAFFPGAVRSKSKPVASFVKQDTAGCSPLVMSFQNTSTGTFPNTTYLWQFGTAGTSIRENPTNIAFRNSGLYDISLIVNNEGCKDTMKIDKMIKVYPPRALFNAYNVHGCDTPHNVIFFDLSDSAITWSWDFGDPLSGAANYAFHGNPSHTYKNFGAYSVKLVVTSSYGCIDSLTRVNFVKAAKPKANFVSNDTLGCAPHSANFTYSGTPGKVFWNINGLAVNNKLTAQNDFGKPGKYNVSVVMQDSIGCFDSVGKIGYVVVNGPTVKFGATNMNGCIPLIAGFIDSSTSTSPITNYLWGFGDVNSGALNSSPLKNPNHVYSTRGLFDVSLKVTDSLGCTADLKKTGYINTMGTVFSFSNDSVVCKDAPMLFTTKVSGTPITSYKWSFGDGSIDSVANPTKTYKVAGIYSVKLVIRNANGCIDSFQRINTVRVRSLKGDFIVNKNSGYCAPFTVQFFDKTPGSRAWQWSFSDSTISFQENPNKTFITNNYFNIKLIVTDTFGCIDTVKKDSLVHVVGPRPMMTLVQSSSCIPSIVQFTNQSAFFSTLTWDMGNGYLTSVTNPNYIYMLPGNYKPIIVAIDSSGCRASYTYPGMITVDTPPVAKFVIPTKPYCNIASVSLQNQSLYSTQYLWYINNSIASSASNPNISLVSGSYNIKLIAKNLNGCSDSLVLNGFKVHANPIAQFTSLSSVICKETDLQLLDRSTSVNGPITSWNWTVSDSVPTARNSVSQNPTFSFPNAGNQQVKLVVSDSTSCTDSITINNYLKVKEKTTPLNENIDLVSVFNPSAVYVQWIKSKNLDFSQYQLLRRSASSNDTFAVVYQTNNQSDTVFYDQSLRTNDSSYQYIVKMKDVCNMVSGIDSNYIHESILIKTAAGLVTGNNGIDLNWNHYKGWRVKSYTIYRRETTQSQFTKIASVQGTVNKFTDNGLCKSEYEYMVDAMKDNGIVESVNGTKSFSNKTINKPNYIVQLLPLDMANVTVDNNRILVIWNKSVQKNAVKYLVNRSEDNGVTFIQKYAIIDANQTQFTDSRVSVNSKQYLYQISVLDSCGFESPLSRNGNSILLSLKLKGFDIQLSWNNQNTFKTGVEQYSVERYNTNLSKWEQIAITSQLTYSDDPSNTNFEHFSYRVKAMEKNGPSVSLSNEVKTVLPPTLFIPTAFSPNNDGLNDTHKILGLNLKEIEVVVVNRWGEIIFQSDNINKSWDGKHNGKDVQSGAYVVTVRAVGNNGTPLLEKAVVNVIRSL